YFYNDADQRVRETTTVTYAGQATVTKEDVTFLVDPLNFTGFSQTLEEHAAGGGVTASYVYGRLPLAQAGPSPSGVGVQFFLQAGRGSTRQLADAAGAVTARFGYDAYGNAVGFDPGAVPTRVLFDGERYDPATRQYYLRARNYDPAAARFTTIDPLA